MSQENVEVVRQMYDAYSRGDNEAALAAFDPEVEMDASVRPEGGVYRGRQGIAEALRTWSGTWEDFKIKVEEMIDAGERVLVAEHQTGRGKGSGIPLDEHTFSIFTVEAGKIVRLVWVPTRAAALAAAGL